MQISVTLPWPSQHLNPHAKGHWRRKSDETTKHRHAAMYEFRRARSGLHGFPWARAVYRLDWTRDARRNIDEANMIHLCKPYIDGAIDAGIVVDDNVDAIRYTGMGIVTRKCARRTVRITITEHAEAWP